MSKKFVRVTVFEWDDDYKHQFTRVAYFNVDDVASIGYTWNGGKNEALLKTIHDSRTYSILETPEEIVRQIDGR